MDCLHSNDERYDFSDTRFVTEKGQMVMLTSMSHLCVAHSKDGFHFTV
ncbi:hypothetical protein [Paenibacillus phytohabitans]